MQLLISIHITSWLIWTLILKHFYQKKLKQWLDGDSALAQHLRCYLSTKSILIRRTIELGGRSSGRAALLFVVIQSLFFVACSASQYLLYGMKRYLLPQINITCHLEVVPADTRRWPNVGWVLGQRRRRWPNTKPTLGQRHVLAGVSVSLKRDPVHTRADLYFNKQQTLTQWWFNVGSQSRTVDQHWLNI